MAEGKFPHLFINRSGESIEYRSPKGVRIKFKIPNRNRQTHADKLRSAFDNIWNKYDQIKTKRTAVSVFKDNEGCYIEVRGSVGSDLITKSLENMRSGIRICNIRKVQENDEQVTIATVFIPERMRGYFVKKINQYANENTRKEKPKNKDFIESIEDIHLAVLESFWQPPEDLDGITKEKQEWCEIWLIGHGEQVFEQFKMFCDSQNIKYENEKIVFPERTVCLAYVNNHQLRLFIESFPFLAELRKAKEPAGFWMNLSNQEQTEWVENLASRLEIVPKPDVSVCILDTGINNGHKLLTPFLADNNRDCFNPAWGKDDHDSHGTLVAGIGVFGDLEEKLLHALPVIIKHKIESVKILPPKGQNPRHLYGAITNQAISRAKINSSVKQRIICLAVTEDFNKDKGKPSSWSGALDKICAGVDDNEQKIIIVCAGNADTSTNPKFKYNYPTANLTDSIHSPGQSWNAITVGAFTEKVHIKDSELSEYRAVAPSGALSPFSTTSFAWGKTKWPLKPDIVMEGGNLGQDRSGFYSKIDDLSVLSTHFKPAEKQFGVFNETSCATAKAAWFAAQIAAQYPDAWPETIRALMIHSATWTEQMKKLFLESDSKGDYQRLIRICGFGVPSLDKAIYCTQNSLTMIIQSQIQPYKKEKSSFTMKDMHLFELPWPKAELNSLHETEVELRVTLSYFIEPGPGEVGWKDKYRYQSHGLRFRLKKPTEKKVDFIKRINKLAREDDGDTNYTSSDKWVLGANNRELGSIHSDIWKGTAAELASCNLIGIYPVVGWWKTRPHLQKWNKKARYSLIVSIHTPETAVDIYTPIKNQIETPVEIKV